MDAWVRCGSAYILRESEAAPSPGGFTGPGRNQTKEDELNNCEVGDKRTLTVVLKQAASKAMELVKLSAIIENRLGGMTPLGGVPTGAEPGSKPKQDCLLETASDISNSLSQALARLDRVATNL